MTQHEGSWQRVAYNAPSPSASSSFPTATPIMTRTTTPTSASKASSAASSFRQRRGPSIKTSTLRARNSALAAKLQQMAQSLQPLVQVHTGAVPRDFPTTMLSFWLLTDAQLESLAIFFHQAVGANGRRSPWATQYPCPVRWQSDASLEEKRICMGCFIGLPVILMKAASSVSVIQSEYGIASDAIMARIVADGKTISRSRRTATDPGAHIGS